MFAFDDSMGPIAPIMNLLPRHRDPVQLSARVRDSLAANVARHRAANSLDSGRVTEV